MSKRRLVNNSARCEGCINCLMIKQNNLDYVRCNSRERTWMYGQHIDPCQDYKRKVNKE